MRLTDVLRYSQPTRVFSNSILFPPEHPSCPAFVPLQISNVGNVPASGSKPFLNQPKRTVSGATSDWLLKSTTRQSRSYRISRRDLAEGRKPSLLRFSAMRLGAWM